MARKLSIEEITYLFQFHGPEYGMIADLIEMFSFDPELIYDDHAIALAAVLVANSSATHGGSIDLAEYDLKTRQTIETLAARIVDDLTNIRSSEPLLDVMEEWVLRRAESFNIDFWIGEMEDREGLENGTTDRDYRAMMTHFAQKLRHRPIDPNELPTEGWDGYDVWVLRQHTDLSIEELALRSGIAIKEIERLEDDTAMPTKEQWERLLEVMCEEAEADGRL